MQGRIESAGEELKESILQKGIQLPDIVSALMNTLRIRDVETEEHSERVCRFSLLLGCQLDLDLAQMNSLVHGSLLHDIGKVGVPDRVLRKPGRLNSEEWTRMREHPGLGFQILYGIPSLAGASLVVAQHHERWDGKGYPFGLRRNEIDQNARIFAVADTLDAIISDRVYRTGQSFEAAAAELERGAGTQFDPAVVQAFNRVGVEEWSTVMANGPVSRNSYVTVGA